MNSKHFYLNNVAIRLVKEPPLQSDYPLDNPEAVVVTEATGKQATTIQLKVASEDMGKVIGKQGKIARALRTVVRAAATKDNKKVIVEIIQ